MGFFEIFGTFGIFWVYNISVSDSSSSIMSFRIVIWYLVLFFLFFGGLHNTGNITLSFFSEGKRGLKPTQAAGI